MPFEIDKHRYGVYVYGRRYICSPSSFHVPHCLDMHCFSDVHALVRHEDAGAAVASDGSTPDGIYINWLLGQTRAPMREQMKSSNEPGVGAGTFSTGPGSGAPTLARLLARGAGFRPLW